MVIHQNRFFHIFRFFDSFHKGVSSRKIESSSTWIFSHFYFFIIFFNYFLLSYLQFLLLFPPWASTLVIYTKIINKKYPLKHSNYLFYCHHLLTHHLQVLTYNHIYCLYSIISTLSPIGTRTTYQIQMTSSHMCSDQFYAYSFDAIEYYTAHSIC